MILSLIPHEIDKLMLLIPFIRTVVFLAKVLAAICFLRLFVGNDGYVESLHTTELIITMFYVAFYYKIIPRFFVSVDAKSYICLTFNG